MSIVGTDVRVTVPQGELALVGPREPADLARLPVRGDLAHIRLAGRCFVPHYAVPDGYRVAAPAAGLRSAARADADLIAELAPGTRFDVLDVAGGWAWGQVDDGGEDGLVGYLPLEAIELP